MSHSYQPIIVDTRMSDYGYWVVTISAAPWRRMSIMICSAGITRDQAEHDALLSYTGISARRVHS